MSSFVRPINELGGIQTDACGQIYNSNLSDMENLINYESILNAAINKDSNAINGQIVHLTPEILNNFLDKIDSLHEKCYPIISNYFSILTHLDSEKTVELLIDVERLSEIQWVRMKISWIFVEVIKESATKKLLSLVNEKKDDDSWDYALDYLVNIGDPKAKDPLFSIFSERKGKRKEEVAIALGKLGDSRVFDTLISAYNNTDSKDRGEIVNALGQIKDKRAVELLISALINNEVEYIAPYVTALEKIKDYRAIEPLISIIDKGINYLKQGVYTQDVEKAILKIIKKEFDVNLIKKIDNPMASYGIHDIFFQNNKYTNYINHQAHDKDLIIRKGNFIIVRVGVGPTGDSDSSPYGANSIIIIEAIVTKILPTDFFYKCTWTPGRYENGLVVNHLDNTVLTNDQKGEVIKTLSEEADWFWRNATDEIKIILSEKITEKDEAHKIYAKGRKAFYDEKNNYEAKKYLQESIRKHNGITGARNILGMIAIDEGDLTNAIKMFENELEYASPPMEHTSHLCLAEIYKNIGESDRASVQLAKAKSLDDSTELSPDLRKKIMLAVEINSSTKNLHEQKEKTTLTAPNKSKKKWWKFW